TWNDSYTGMEISEIEMREWLDTTIERIKLFKPVNILEIGCGTGMYLFKLYSMCSSYSALDTSSESLNYIETVMRKSNKDFANVKLFHCRPEDFKNDTGIKYDFCLMNSVVQYFPNIDYLIQVISKVISISGKNSIIYIGDVRNFDLLKAFHTSLALSKLPEDTEINSLKSHIEDMCEKEEELLISPAFFYSLQARIPEIVNIEIRYKKGKSLNELTRFRYDAILFINCDSKTTPHMNMVNIDWTENLTTEHIIQKLSREEPEVLRISCVLNNRTEDIFNQIEILENNPRLKTVQDVLDYQEHFSYYQSPEPSCFFDIHQNYYTEILWSGYNMESFFDIVYYKKSLYDESFRSALPFLIRDYSQLPEIKICNNPVHHKIIQQFIHHIKNLLKEQLPDSLIPDYIHRIESIPLTERGDIAYEKLPVPWEWLKKDVMKNHKNNDSYAADVSGNMDEIEGNILKICQEELGIVDIDKDQILYELGASSINIVLIEVKIESEYNIDIPFEIIYKKPSVRELAKYINDINISIEGD
ncbi:MAG: methyltransferase domain-containing protein, partial [Spirochaetales bacterium]|nr:methyltransferase domain-containing protein [Spirochaetales bacterium]